MATNGSVYDLQAEAASALGRVRVNRKRVHVWFVESSVTESLGAVAGHEATGGGGTMVQSKRKRNPLAQG